MTSTAIEVAVRWRSVVRYRLVVTIGTTLFANHGGGWRFVSKCGELPGELSAKVDAMSVVVDAIKAEAWT